MLIISLPVHYQRSQTPVHFFLLPEANSTNKRTSTPFNTKHDSKHHRSHASIYITQHDQHVGIIMQELSFSRSHYSCENPDATLVAISVALNKHR